MSIFNPTYETKKRLGLLGKDRKDCYKRFLQTKRWKTKRNGVVKERKVCEVCGSAIDFNVHHKTYFRLGDELDQDLQLLCRTCHETKHHLKPRAKPRIRLNTVRQRATECDEDGKSA